MTTGANRFTPREGSIVAGAPLLTAMWVLAGERGGMRATLAVVSACRAARGDYDSELLRDLLATAPADAINRPHDREALRREAPRLATGARHRRARWYPHTSEMSTGASSSRSPRRPSAPPAKSPRGRARATHTDSGRDALRSITALLDR